MLGGESRHTQKLQRLARVHGVADRELTGVDQTEDVAGVRHVDGFAVAAEEPVRA